MPSTLLASLHPIRASLGLVLTSGIVLIWATGMLLWLVGGIGLAGLITFVRSTRGMPQSSGHTLRIPLVCISLAAGLTAVEGVLWLIERTTLDRPVSVGEAKPAEDLEVSGDNFIVSLPLEIQRRIERMQSAVLLPREWERRKIYKIDRILDIEERKDPYSWHGVAHVYDENKMRREEPFPAKNPQRFRVMVVGDSLTYGQGIDTFWTYPSQLQRSLESDFKVEILNLGVQGYQSEDVLRVVRRFLAQLDPALVIYGMCLNDFLPSRVDQPVHYVFPIPNAVRKFFVRRTRVGRLLEDRYDALLRQLGLRPDFYADLLSDFEAYDERFGRDVAAMNAFVTETGLPPVVAMVLDQTPKRDGPGRRLALAAERHLAAAGMTVVETEAYYRRFDGRNFAISRWDGHPNEEANAIFALFLERALREHPGLAPYQKPYRKP